MPEIDGDSGPSSTPFPNPNPNPNSKPSNGGSAPQLKRSRTISADGAPPAAASPLFHGPLHPAVRRSTTSPLRPHRRLTVAVDDPSDASPNAGTFDREWFFPSFLGPYPSRPRAAVRATAGSRPQPAPRRPELPSPLPDRKGLAAAAAARSPDRILTRVSEVEKKKKEVVKRPLVLEERKQLSLPSSTSAASARRFLRFDHSLLIILVSLLILRLVFKKLGKIFFQTLPR